MDWASTVAVVVPSPATSGGLGSDFLDHLRAHVLELVLELDLLGDGNAVLGDRGGTEGLVENERCGPWGPSVTLTASARTLTPASMPAGAVTEFDFLCASEFVLRVISNVWK